MMLEEVERLNNYKGKDREDYLKKRVSEAIANLENIPKNIIKSQKNSDYYKLLKNINKIM